MSVYQKYLKIPSLILFKLLFRNSKFILIGIFLIGALSLSLLKFGPMIMERDHLTEGMIGTYQRHDLPEAVTKLLSRSLVNFNKEGRIVSDLAEYSANKELTEFTFKLKDSAWIDGTKVKSTDLEFGIDDVEVSYPDEKTLVFKLKEPFAPLPSLLTKPVFKKGTSIGTGPYEVKNTEISRIFLTKINLESKDPSLPKLIIRFYPNEKTALTAMSIGEIQSLLGVNDTSLTSQKTYELKQETSYSKVVSILYNTKDPVLGNRSLRQALSYGAPLVKNEVEAKTPIAPFSWSYSEDDVNDYLSNEKEAKAAFGRAKGNMSAEQLKKEIVLTTTPQYNELGKQIIESWQKLGIKAVLRVESGIPQNFQALLIAQTIPIDPDQYALWHSTQTQTNLTGYDSKRVDKDLEDGRKISDEKERLKHYADFQRILLEDSPATFLYFPKYNVIFLKKAESKLTQVLPLQLPR